MPSHPDLDVAPGALPPGGVSPSAGDTWAGPSGADDRVEHRCEVLLQPDLDPPRTVVAVVGLLGRSGGALLAAVLEYVREREGGPVAVDLRGVSQADRHGLAPVIESGAVLAGTSPAVEQVLSRGTRALTDLARRAWGAGPAGCRVPASRPRTGGAGPTVGPGETSSEHTTSDPTS